MINSGDGILPHHRLSWHVWAHIAGTGPHVAVSQLEPGPGEGVFKLFRIIPKAHGDFAVRRVELQGQVGGQHDRRVEFAFYVRIRNQILGVVFFWNPLRGTSRAFGLNPFKGEQVGEELG